MIEGAASFHSWRVVALTYTFVLELAPLSANGQNQKQNQKFRLVSPDGIFV